MATRKQSTTDAESPAEMRPLRVPGVDAGEVQLGDKTYHLAVHTTYGLQDIRNRLLSEVRALSTSAGTVGDYLLAAAFFDNNFTTVKAVLDCAIVEKLPDDIVYRSAPEQLIATINRFVATSGMGWFETIVKNAGAASSDATTILWKQEMSRRLLTVGTDTP